MSTQRARGRREEHVGSDVTSFPSEASNANRSSILEVEQSNRFAALAKMMDNAETESSASVTYTCDKAHCTGGHFQGKHAKREYARHIEIKHRGALTESEINLDLHQCPTCGKVTYWRGAKLAKKHQDACAAQTSAVQAKRRKDVEKSSSVGAAATGKQRKWQPHFSRRAYARREVDLTDTITDADIDDFFGPLDLMQLIEGSRATRGGQSERYRRERSTLGHW